jgi:hypothetical protein
MPGLGKTVSEHGRTPNALIGRGSGKASHRESVLCCDGPPAKVDANSSRRPFMPMTLDPLANEPPPVLSAAAVSATSATAAPDKNQGLLSTGFAQFKRLTQIGLPRRFPIVQFPNAPLILAFLAGVLATHIHVATRSYATAASYLAMTVWAYEELARGVNWFRRLLGLAYIIILITRVAHGLQG